MAREYLPFLFLLVLSWQKYGSISATNTEDVLQDLISVPLKEDNSILIVDDTKDQLIKWNLLEKSNIKIMISDAKTMNLSSYDLQTMQGARFTLIWIVDSNETNFQNIIGDPLWYPQYIVILIVNAAVSRRDIFDLTLCKKIEYTITISPRKDNPESFFVSTSYPYPDNKIKRLYSWEPANFKTKTAMFADRFKDLGGSTLKIATFCDDYPFLYPVDDDKCAGTSFDLLDITSSVLNYTYDYQMQPVDCKWGSYDDGKWNGMLADIAYRGQDLVINVFVLNHERWDTFDSTYPYKAEGFSFIASLPDPLPKWNSLLLPFTWELWLSILVITAGAAASLITLSTLSRTQTFPIGEASLLVFGSLVSKSILSKSSVSDTQWKRVWFIVWWLSCIIITTGYTGNLIAFLTIPIYPVRLETAEDVAKSPKKTVMQDYGNFVPIALRNSKDSVLSEIGKKLELFPYGNHFDAGMEMVVNKTHVLIETHSYLAGLQIEYGLKEKTYLLKEQIYSSHMSWFLPKFTPYTGRLSDVLTRLMEAGIVEKLFYDHYGTTEEDRQQIVEITALSLDQLQGAFMLMGFGMGGSLLSFIFENILGRCCLK